MNCTPYRNMQNLPRIGQLYSTKDEKQRQIANAILEGTIKPELKLKINIKIIGLEKRNQFSL